MHAQPALIKRGWLALPLRGQGGLQGQARTCGGRAATAGAVGEAATAGAVGETATAGVVGNCECAAMRQAKNRGPQQAQQRDMLTCVVQDASSCVRQG